MLSNSINHAKRRIKRIRMNEKAIIKKWEKHFKKDTKQKYRKHTMFIEYDSKDAKEILFIINRIKEQAEQFRKEKEELDFRIAHRDDRIQYLEKQLEEKEKELYHCPHCKETITINRLEKWKA